MKKAISIMLSMMMISAFAFTTFAETGSALKDGDFEAELRLGEPGYLRLNGEANGAKMVITDEEKYTGKSSLKVTDRVSAWSGPCWDVKDYLTENGNGVYYASGYIKNAEGGASQQAYLAIYVKYESGAETWLVCGLNTNINDSSWSELNLDDEGKLIPLKDSKSDYTVNIDTEGIQTATFYITCEAGQTSPFFIDDVALYKQDEQIVSSEADQSSVAYEDVSSGDVSPQESAVLSDDTSETGNSTDLDGNSDSNLWVYIIAGTLVILVAVVVTASIIKSKKRKV